MVRVVYIEGFRLAEDFPNEQLHALEALRVVTLEHDLVGHVHGVDERRGHPFRGQRGIVGVVDEILEEQPFKEHAHLAGNAVEIDGRAEDDAVRIGEALQNRRQTVPDGAFAVAFPAEALALEAAHASGKIMAVEMDQFRLRLRIGRLHAFKGFVQDGCGVVGFSRASVDGIIRHGVLLAFGAGAPA